ncbi:hypothetical protein [Helicobacter pylori]|uniref:hypothetical protein n=1 Tax=Helicobacter pylori TaxID=210 RepID=UPI001F0A016F|nr:hypothetical protein [Helicobacter pylori]
MAVRFGIIFITDNYTIDRRVDVALDYALINDIKYNLLDNTFHFIFDIGNSLLKESSQLIIEMPREALDLIVESMWLLITL